jgi:single-stranded-DNA-specific exonuclease
VAGFDVYQALNQCAEHMLQFGGHKYAAGLTLHKDNLPQFKDAFNTAVKEQANHQMFTPKQVIDLELSLADVHLPFKRLLDKLEPYGPANMSPVFLTKNLIDAGNSRAVGEDKTHLKLQVVDPETGIVVDGIAFGFGHLADAIRNKVPFDVVYNLDENHWKGKVTLQLMVKDIRLTDSSH